MNILEVNNISKSFVLEQNFATKIKGIFSSNIKPPTLKALDEITFSMKQGEILGILGESGSGKSTLARILMGIIKPDGGNIKLYDEEIIGISGEKKLNVLRQMQMIFQDPFSSLDPRMTVKQILLEPLRIHNMVPEKNKIHDFLAEKLKQVGLNGNALSSYPSEFSGGQRQRIGICRALLLNPKLIIADEAVSALDVSVQAQILDLLINLKKSNDLSIIFISHDVAVVRQISDRIIMLYKGKIVEDIMADDLLTKAKHEYTKKLLNAALYLREKTAL